MTFFQNFSPPNEFRYKTPIFFLVLIGSLGKGRKRAGQEKADSSARVLAPERTKAKSAARKGSAYQTQTKPQTMGYSMCGILSRLSFFFGVFSYKMDDLKKRYFFLQRQEYILKKIDSTILPLGSHQTLKCRPIGMETEMSS